MVRVPLVPVPAGQPHVLIPLELIAPSPVQGLSVTVSVDPRWLRYEGVELTGIPGAQLLVKDTHAADGSVGLLIALPTGAPLPPGRHQIATLRFALREPVPATGLAVSLTAAVVAREVVDGQGHPLPARYEAGRVIPTGRRRAAIHSMQ